MCVLFSTRIRLPLCIRIVAAQRGNKINQISREYCYTLHQRTVNIENRGRFVKRTRVTVAVSVHRAETMLYKNKISCSNFTGTGPVRNVYISKIVGSRCCFKKLKKKPNISVFKRAITIRHRQLVSTLENTFYNLTFDHSIVCIILICSFVVKSLLKKTRNSFIAQRLKNMDENITFGHFTHLDFFFFLLVSRTHENDSRFSNTVFEKNQIYINRTQRVRCFQFYFVNKIALCYA